MTTKEQERKALAQIREIVDSLGADSYIGLAFEGCFEDAETNIENDWALSMNGRWQDAEQKLEAVKAERDDAQRAAIEAQVRIAELEPRILSADDMTDCIGLLTEKIFELSQDRDTAAKEIVKLADSPAAKEFTQAVRNHRNAVGNIEYYENLQSRIRTARDTTN